MYLQRNLKDHETREPKLSLCHKNERLANTSKILKGAERSQQVWEVIISDMQYV